MSLEKIDIVGTSTVSLPILNSTTTTPYVLKNADGLGPPDIDLYISRTRPSGGVYQNRFPQNRQLVLRVGLNPNHTINQTPTQMRASFYEMLNPVDALEIRLHGSLGNETIRNGPQGPYYVIKKTYGYVKRIEIVPFSKDPEIQITIDCLSPYFEGETSHYQDSVGSTNYTFNNPGTADSPFYATVQLAQNVEYFKLFDVPYGVGSSRFIKVNYPLLSGDLLTISTIPGYKKLEVWRDSVLTNLLGYLDPESTWMTTHPGSNSFHIEDYASGTVPNVTTFYIEFLEKYWGV